MKHHDLCVSYDWASDIHAPHMDLVGLTIDLHGLIK